MSSRFTIFPDKNQVTRCTKTAIVPVVLPRPGLPDDNFRNRNRPYLHVPRIILCLGFVFFLLLHFFETEIEILK